MYPHLVCRGHIKVVRVCWEYIVQGYVGGMFSVQGAYCTIPDAVLHKYQMLYQLLYCIVQVPDPLKYQVFLVFLICQLSLQFLLLLSFNYLVSSLSLVPAHRVYLDDEDSVINYKLCTWSSLKIEGWSTVGEKQTSQNQLRLIVGATSIRIVFKRRVSDSSLMYSRISMHLGELYDVAIVMVSIVMFCVLCNGTGDLLWILTQSQLRAVSRLVQSLMDAAVRTQQLKRIGSEDGGTDSDQESVDSFDSVSSSNDRGKPISNNKAGNTKGKTKKTRSSRSSQRHEKVLSERMKEYMDGRRNLPSHEVIQSSFHLKTGKADLQLCDDTASNGVQGSLLIQVLLGQWAKVTAHLGTNRYRDKVQRSLLAWVLMCIVDL